LKTQLYLKILSHTIFSDIIIYNFILYSGPLEHPSHTRGAIEEKLKQIKMNNMGEKVDQNEVLELINEMKEDFDRDFRGLADRMQVVEEGQNEIRGFSEQVSQKVEELEKRLGEGPKVDEAEIGLLKESVEEIKGCLESKVGKDELEKELLSIKEAINDLLEVPKTESKPNPSIFEIYEMKEMKEKMARFNELEASLKSLTEKCEDNGEKIKDNSVIISEILGDLSSKSGNDAINQLTERLNSFNNQLNKVIDHINRIQKQMQDAATEKDKNGSDQDNLLRALENKIENQGRATNDRLYDMEK
jgi:uncharacterized phage infection (PIP) family protein YhgE